MGWEAKRPAEFRWGFDSSRSKARYRGPNPHNRVPDRTAISCVADTAAGLSSGTSRLAMLPGRPTDQRVLDEMPGQSSGRASWFCKRCAITASLEGSRVGLGEVLTRRAG